MTLCSSLPSWQKLREFNAYKVLVITFFLSYLRDELLAIIIMVVRSKSFRSVLYYYRKSILGRFVYCVCSKPGQD